MISLELSEEARRFRDEIRELLRRRLPADIRALGEADRMDYPREMYDRWQRILFEEGLAQAGWPEEYGGRGWSDEQHYVFRRELAYAGAPRLDSYGVHMLAPTLIEYGSDAQKERFLPATAKGDIRWCQGFSEPGAGSDLAALSTKAEQDGDEYFLNGSKIWTSEAHIADWMFGIFRTDTSGRKQQGITFLMLDMRTPGVRVEPLISFGGTHEVNQVFFDDVRVPVENRIGEENQGWGIAKFLLANERFDTAEVARARASLKRLKQLARKQERDGGRAIDDPEVAREIAISEIELRALEVTEQRLLFSGEAGGAEASLLKIRGTEIHQRILELTHRLLGAFAALDGWGMYSEGAQAPSFAPSEVAHAGNAHFNFRKTSIYSGSNEIQKIIIAKAVLEL